MMQECGHIFFKVVFYGKPTYNPSLVSLPLYASSKRRFINSFCSPI